MRVGNDEAGFLEPAGGALMARRAIQSLASELSAKGVTFLSGAVSPIRQEQGEHGALAAVITKSGERLDAEQFVCACGPWLDRICPDAMAKRLFVTRQEVYFFSVEAGATGDLPVGRFPSASALKAAASWRTTRMDCHLILMRRSAAENWARPAGSTISVAGQGSIEETRVCQYENSSNGDFVIDRHPGLDVSGSSDADPGMIQNGPAVGSHIAELPLVQRNHANLSHSYNTTGSCVQ
jgi:hypothetical protein